MALHAAGDEPAPGVQDSGYERLLGLPGQLFEPLPAAVYVCDAAGVIVRYNQRAAGLWGRSPKPGDTDQRFCGSYRLYRLDGSLLPHAQTPMAEVLATGRPARDCEVVIERPDGTQIIVLVNIDPLFDPAGGLIGAINCFQDITTRKRTEQALRESEERLRLAVDSTELGTWDFDPTTGALTLDDRSKALFGLSSDPPVDYDTFLGGVHPDDRETTHAAVERALDPEGPGGFEIEYRSTGLRDDEGEHWIAARGRAFFAAGRAVRLIGTVLDITARHRAEERQRLLLSELNHRVKNTLATVQALAVQTLRNASSPDAFRTVFEARLMALSSAHDLLTRGNWAGAELRDVLQQALAPYHDGKATAEAGPLALKGGPVRLTPRAALTLGMAFHELATNAAKYGALSVPTGRVQIIWGLEASDGAARLRIDWQEAGGPQPEPPARHGFGLRLIERSIENDLEGEVRLDFGSKGLRCEVEIPPAVLAGGRE